MIPYKRKMITFHDMTMKSESIILSLEEFKYIFKLMLQDNQETILKMHKELEEVIANKNE